MWIVLEPTKAEIGKQRGTDGLIEPRRQAVIVNDGASTQPANSASYTTQPDAQIGLAIETIVGTCVAAKDMQVSRGLVVTACIKSISVEWARTRTEEIIGQVGVYWCRKELQHFYSRGRQSADRNQVARERSASRTSVDVARRWVIYLPVTVRD